MIVGVGVDLVDITRFIAMLHRVPTLADRVFLPEELLKPDGTARPPESLAARFAAKEAVAKALGAPPGLSFQGSSVQVDPHGAPSVELHGSVLARSQELGITRFDLSLSHDGGMAIAFVVASRD